MYKTIYVPVDNSDYSNRAIDLAAYTWQPVRAEHELERLRMIPPESAEHTVVRTYLEWLVTLPWAVSTEDNLDLPHARQVLDEDHYDLAEIKARILEYLAVRQLRQQRLGTDAANQKGAILCFVGPPGVGKTSLGRSIARATRCFGSQDRRVAPDSARKSTRQPLPSR